LPKKKKHGRKLQGKNMQFADANIVLRYVLNDHPELSKRAAEILEHQDIVLLSEVICEVVYVLQKVYRVAREQIQIKLSEMISEGLITVEKPDVLKYAL
jgi:predicted nucleic-acid-binding protein